MLPPLTLTRFLTQEFGGLPASGWVSFELRSLSHRNNMNPKKTVLLRNEDHFVGVFQLPED